jgi:putative ABC transport system ATP-binding protein
MTGDLDDRPMLALTKVTKTYRIGGQTVHALDDLTLTLTGGQFVSVVGPSGAGKSTLLHLLGALDRPDFGSIRFEGNEISDLDDDQQSEFRRHRVGFVFQFFNLLPTMTAWENVAVPKVLDGTRMAKVKSRALELLELVDLGDRAEHRPSELSGGQMQRVAVARALMMDPPLLLADEPVMDSAMPKTATSKVAEIPTTTRDIEVRPGCARNSRRLNARMRSTIMAVPDPLVRRRRRGRRSG